ncbi:hypothetical protein CBM2589_B90036 [Cupriavidus taiwanensis]|uniref:Uncharacterized protein n=1 Tax=Cupriavidus taiwanensis TaxID=164546 RepID=A0A375BY57_9BURK|nr:hypothetical protein [Cupriavidus taiwanensis]SOY58334.1 hypothetical protein CBM2589_B90036 [Cupriavidus taiwanensis]
MKPFGAGCRCHVARNPARAWLPARAYAKASGLAAEVSGYPASGDRMAEVMVGYANGYAEMPAWPRISACS